MINIFALVIMKKIYIKKKFLSKSFISTGALAIMWVKLYRLQTKFIEKYVKKKFDICLL